MYYWTLNLIFLIPKLGFKFYNHDFVCSIKHLPYQTFRRHFLNFECHNERYQEHFFNNFHGRAHCTTSCDICIEHDSNHFSRINLQLSCFKAISIRKMILQNSVLSLALMRGMTNSSKPLHQEFFIINVPLHILFQSSRNNIFIVFHINPC